MTRLNRKGQPVCVKCARLMVGDKHKLTGQVSCNPYQGHFVKAGVVRKKAEFFFEAAKFIERCKRQGLIA